MSNSTPDYWDAGGVSLQTYAWGIDAWGVSEAPPVSRGSDLVVPSRIGQVARDRVPDGRTITLPMWVSDTDQDGDPVVDPVSQFTSNWETLRGALWNGGRSFTLTKRWDDGASSAAATVVFAGGLEPAVLGDRTAARFTCDLYAADPWFYGASDNDTFSIGATDPAWSGTAPTPHYTVRFTGTSGFSNPSVSTAVGGTTLSTLSYAGAIGNGEYVQITLPSFTFATTVAGASVTNFSSTTANWLHVDPAVTTVTVAGTGTGTCTITYTPAYL